MGKHREKKPAFGKKSRTSRVPMVASLLAAAALVAALQWLLSSSAATDAGSQHRRASSSSPASPSSPRERRAASEVSAQRRGADAYSGHEWRNLSRSLPHCLSSQAELMSIPVPWPGFHALCIESFGDGEVSVLLHARSARHGDAGGEPPLAAGPEETRVLRAGVQGGGGDLLDLLVEALQAELAEGEFRQVDQMVSTSAYDFHPNPWRLFTTNGGPVLSGADLAQLGPGAALWLYTGGQFLWPGVRIGHKFRVPIPRVAEDGEHSETKMVEMTTASLRPLVLVLSGFLSDGECDFIKSYAASRMVPSGLAVMDGTRGDQSDVRTSTQTFMQRGGSPRIRALEERAHNLTRLPYDNGENIQVVRYEKGQKYGAHRDFFNPNDYHRQPSMLRSVEYGARNRLATVFWYLQSVDEGGETFFPRALNEEGREYNPWNGDHEDCYRGLFVPPVRGNAVLFYSMVPDGRLDERSLHGGCKPRGEKAEKWGANQWIWNHPQRSGYFTKTPPRRGLRARRPSAAGCADEEEHCEAWAAGGECDKNSGFMARSCRASCGLC